jgi:hypothetical protein
VSRWRDPEKGLEILGDFKRLLEKENVEEKYGQVIFVE